VKKEAVFMSVRIASITSLACLGSLAAFSVFVACKGDADAIGEGPLGERDSSVPPPDASVSATSTDAGTSLDASREDASAQAPACPECCAQCLVTLVPSYAENLISDGTYLYLDDGVSVKRLPLGGGPMTTLASGRPGIRQLLIDPASIYWTEMGTCEDGGTLCVPRGNVVQMPIDGGTPVTLATDTSPAWGLAKDATRVYWSDEGTNIMSAPLDGGVATTLASSNGLAFGLAVSSEGVYWFEYSLGCTAGIDDAGPCVGNLMTVSIDGGAATVFAGDQKDPSLIGMQDGSVEWLTEVTRFGATSTFVVSASLSGGLPAEVAKLPGAADSFGSDSTAMYWTSNGSVMSTALDGGATTTLAVGQNYPVALLVTPASLYWSDYPTASYQAPYPTSSPDSGAIMMLTPK
jgi:hypothetical protein